MNRKKRTRTSRKSSPLSIDLRDFLMYSNPSMFAPKVRANGGEAYPQAPTMNQFFDYGHPTPQVPFVFQTGGMMDFSEGADDRRANFLNKIKEAAANAVQKEFENEAFDYEDQANAMFQSGGPFNMDFSKANAWASAQQPSNFYNAASNFATLWDAAQSGPTETYIKRWKQQQLPIAQTGLQNEDPTAGMTRDQRLNYWRSQRNLAPGTIIDQVTSNDKGIKDQVIADHNARQLGLDPLTGQPLPKGMQVPGKGSDAPSIVDKTIENLEKDKQEAAKNPPPQGTTTGKDANGNDVSKKPEAQKTPDAAAQTPPPGSKEESNAAAAAGMSPEQYRTFLTRATVNNRRAILPGNRLRSMDFYFDTYGPGMNPITASAPGVNNQQVTGTGNMSVSQNSAGVPGGANNQNTQPQGDGFLRRFFGRPDEQSRWNTEKGPKREGIQSPIGTSQFNPEGYSDKNYMSDLRNQRATDRLTRLGERIDRNIQRERSLDDFYNAPISDRMQRLRERDLRRYNRIAGRFDRNEYTEPTRAMGGGMGYFQPGGENDIYGTAGYSTDGYDATEREDYAGNTIYDEAPAEYQAQIPGQKVGSNKMTAIFGHYNPYEAPMMLAGLQATAGLMDRRNQRKLQGEWMGKTSADQVYTKDFEKDRGDYTMNEGYFRPDDMVPVKNAGYNFQSYYAKMGGSYKKGGEYYLSDEEIQRIIDMGGEVEFLED